MRILSESKFRNVAVLFLVVVLAGPGVNWVCAQDENPFGTSNKAQGEDPFANHAQVAAENPFGHAANVNPLGDGNNGADSFARNKGQKPAQFDAKLQAELRSYQHRLSQLKSENQALRQKVNFCENVEQSLTDSYLTVIERLLKSSDESLQMIALEELAQLEAKIQLTDAIDSRLVELAELGGPGVSKWALRWLNNHEPAEAVKLGYQLKGPWMPMSTSQKYTEVQRVLAEPAFFDFEETELLEVAEGISDNCRLNVMISSEVDSAAPVTYKSSGLSLRTSFYNLLAANELALHVHDDYLEIVPKGLPEPKQTLVYNIKGLLHDELTLDRIEGQINNMLTGQGLDGQVLAIDKHRFSVTAPDSAHHKVAEFLGQLR